MRQGARPSSHGSRLPYVPMPYGGSSAQAAGDARKGPFSAGCYYYNPPPAPPHCACAGFPPLHPSCVAPVADSGPAPPVRGRRGEPHSSSKGRSFFVNLLETEGIAHQAARLRPVAAPWLRGIRTQVYPDFPASLAQTFTEHVTSTNVLVAFLGGTYTPNVFAYVRQRLLQSAATTPVRQPPETRDPLHPAAACEQTRGHPKGFASPAAFGSKNPWTSSSRSSRHRPLRLPASARPPQRPLFSWLPWQKRSRDTLLAQTFWWLSWVVHIHQTFLPMSANAPARPPGLSQQQNATRTAASARRPRRRPRSFPRLPGPSCLVLTLRMTPGVPEASTPQVRGSGSRRSQRLPRAVTLCCLHVANATRDRWTQHPRLPLPPAFGGGSMGVHFLQISGMWVGSSSTH
jgi:hypothetical protein